MSKQFVIQWKSKVNGRAGRGTKHFNREAAEQLVQELNHEFPQIEHEIREALPEGQPQSDKEGAAETPEAAKPVPLLSLG